MYDIDSRFTIPRLKAVCTALGLTVGGLKEDLQGRLTTHLNLLLQRGDAGRYSLAKSSAEVQRGSSYGARVKYVPSGRHKIDLFQSTEWLSRFFNYYSINRYISTYSIQVHQLGNDPLISRWTTPYLFPFLPV